MPTDDDDDPEALIQIGWRERIDLPDWGLTRVHAKIDTGARTSALDVAQIEYLPDNRIRFEVVFRTQPGRRTRWVEADLVRTSTIKNTGGTSLKRPVCRTRLRIGPVEREVEISLVRRDLMRCRMLVGRRALAGAFVVDSSRTHVLTRRPQAAKRDSKEQTRP